MFHIFKTKVSVAVMLMQNNHTLLIEMLDKYDREIAQLTRYKLLEVINQTCTTAALILS